MKQRSFWLLWMLWKLWEVKMDAQVLIKLLEGLKALLAELKEALQSCSQAQNATKTAEFIREKFNLPEEEAEKIASELVNANQPLEILEKISNLIGNFQTVKVATDENTGFNTGSVKNPDEILLDFLNN